MLKYWKRLIIALVASLVLYAGINIGRVIWLMRIPSGAGQAQSERLYDVAVIGAGAAGSMAAYRSVLNNDSTLWITGEFEAQRHARGFWVPYLSNTPIYARQDRPLIRYRNDVVRAIVDGPQKDKLAVLEDSIGSIHRDASGRFTLTDLSGKCYHAQYVILATGMMDEQPQINGSIHPILSYANEQQAIYCSRCDGHLMADKESATVIGYTSSAAQNAIMLYERYHTAMSILTNGNDPQWSEQEAAQLKHCGISVHTTAIVAIHDASLGSMGSFELANGCEVPAQLAVVALGIRPNNELAKQLKADLDERGLVVTDENGLSSVPGLYVAGDLRADTRKQVYVAWDSAVRSAEAINRELRAAKRA